MTNRKKTIRIQFEIDRSLIPKIQDLVGDEVEILRIAPLPSVLMPEKKVPDPVPRERVNARDKSRRFQRPKLKEVREYVESKGYSFSAEEFYNYYESVDWMRGRNKIKD